MAGGILPDKDALVIEQGQRFTVTFTVYSDDPPTALTNITGYTARMIAAYPNVDGTILFDLSSDDATPRIAITGASGLITVDIPGSVTSAYEAFPKGIFQVMLTDGSGNEERLITGQIKCLKEIGGA